MWALDRDAILAAVAVSAHTSPRYSFQATNVLCINFVVRLALPLDSQQPEALHSP